MAAIAGMIFKWLGGKAVQKGISAISGFVKGKLNKAENLDNLDAKYNLRTLKAGEGSLKDEYLTFITTLPIVQMIVGSFVYAFQTPGDPKIWFEAAQMSMQAISDIEGTYATLLYMNYTFVFGKAGMGVAQRHQVKKSIITKTVEKVGKNRFFSK